MSVWLFCEPAVDGRVIMAADPESTFCEQFTVSQIGTCAFSFQNLQQDFVFGPAGYNDNVLKVFGAGTDQRNAANIYLFDNIFIGSAAGNGLLKGIEVNDYKINGRNFILLHLLNVSGIVASGQDSTKYFWMQSLHSAAQNRGVRGNVFYFLAFIT